MLAKCRKINFPSGYSIDTPLLLPSFSSKTFQNEKVQKIVEYASAVITDEILISAYDISYKELKKGTFTFQSAIFLDSGGYEATEDADLSDTGKENHQPKGWTMAQHKLVLSEWDFDVPTIVISFDSPTAKCNLEK